MKKFLKGFFYLFYSLFFIILGLFILDIYFQYVIQYETLIQKIDYFMGDKFAIFLTGSIFIAIPFVGFVVCLLGGRKESYLKFKTDEGEISISIYAVEDIVKKTVRTFREVKDAYPTITLKGKEAIEVSMKLKIWSGIQNLPILLEEIQKEIRAHLQNMIGIESIQGINIYLAKDSFANRDIIPKNRRSVIQNDKKIYIPPVSQENIQDKETETERNQDNPFGMND